MEHRRAHSITFFESDLVNCLWGTGSSNECCFVLDNLYLQRKRKRHKADEDTLSVQSVDVHVDHAVCIFAYLQHFTMFKVSVSRSVIPLKERMMY